MLVDLRSDNADLTYCSRRTASDVGLAGNIVKVYPVAVIPLNNSLCSEYHTEFFSILKGFKRLSECVRVEFLDGFRAKAYKHLVCMVVMSARAVSVLVILVMMLMLVVATLSVVMMMLMMLMLVVTALAVVVVMLVVLMLVVAALAVMVVMLMFVMAAFTVVVMMMMMLVRMLLKLFDIRFKR